MNARGMPENDSSAAPPHILVVEDEILIRDLISMVLRENGAVVAEAANADEAWNYISAGYPVDLVFTDHRMPGSMSGLDLAVRIKAEHPHIAVVIASGNLQSPGAAQPVLAKPYPLEETAAALTRRALLARCRD